MSVMDEAQVLAWKCENTKADVFEARINGHVVRRTIGWGTDEERGDRQMAHDFETHAASLEELGDRKQAKGYRELAFNVIFNPEHCDITAEAGA